MIAYDFFCGAGGLTRGLLNVGIEVKAGFDWDPKRQCTYEHNNPNVDFVLTDIHDLRPGAMALPSPAICQNDLLLAACAPCQPFSAQRKGTGPRDEAVLLGEFGRLVDAILPAYVLVENVPGIARVKGFSTFRRFCRMLDSNHYKRITRVLDAKHFGVAQNRRRLVLFAARHRTPSMPAPSHGLGKQQFRTVRQSIARFPPIPAGGGDPEFLNHVAASVSDLNLQRLQSTPHDGGDRRSWPAHLRLQCHSGGYGGHTDVYGRMFWDRPAPALTGRCYSVSNGRYGHPDQDRAISLREAAAIQSFPDRYRFFGSNTDIAKQVGNAVPVRFAECLGRHILFLQRESYLRAA